MELRVLKLEREKNLSRASERDLWVPGSEGGNTTGSSHICRAHPREAQRAAGSKAFITLLPLLLIMQSRAETEERRPISIQDQTRSRSRRMKCPPLIGRSPQRRPAIDTWEISSRRPQIRLMYERRPAAPRRLSPSRAPSAGGRDLWPQPTHQNGTEHGAVRPNCPFFLLISRYTTRASSS